MVDPGAGLSAGDIQERASRGALWTGLHVLVSLPLNVVSTVVTARVLDLEGYGTLAFLSVVFAIAQQATDLGYTSATVQWGSQARVHGDDALLGSFLSKVTGFHLFVQAPLLVATALVVLRDEPPPLVLGFVVANIAMLYLSGGSLALVLDQRNDRLAQVALATNIVTQVAVILTAVATESAVPVLVARAVASCLPGMAALGLTRATLRWAVMVPRSPRHVPSGFWRFSVYAWGASCIALLVYSRSEILLLQGLSTAEQTALYALAFGVAQQLTTPVEALVGPLIPATASLAAGHRDRFVRAVQRAMALSALLSGGLMAVGLPALFVVFPLLYGEQYAPAAPLVVVLGVMSTFMTATSITGVVVQAQRRGRDLLTANAIALVAGVCVSAVLIPSTGAWGALVGNCVGQCVSIGLLARSAGQGQPAVPWRDLARSLRPWLAGLPAVVIAASAGAALRQPLSGVGAAAVAALLGAVMYVATARALHLGPPTSDVEATLGALPVRVRGAVRWSAAWVAEPERSAQA